MIHIYLNFDGKCREAISFYQMVFQTETPKILSYKDMPEDSEYPLSDKEKDYVMHSELQIAGCKVMFSDIPSFRSLTIGNNITMAIIDKNPETLKRWFEKLSEGGNIEMELQKTTWSSCYGSVIDKFGINWQVNCEV